MFEDNSLIFSFVYRTISNTILSNQELYTIDMIDKPIKSIQDTASESISIDNNIEPLKTIETNLEYKDKSSVLNKTNQLELFENAEIQNPKNTEQKECNLSNRNLYNNELKQNISLENKQEIKTNEQTKEFSQYKVKIYDTKNDEILELKNVNIDKVNESVIPFEFNSITKNDLNKNTFFKQGFNTNALENLQIDNEENLQKLSKGVSLLQKGYKVVGKLFNTYLFIECNDCAILIDQHATHERLIYDKLKKYYDNKNVVTQDLLVPYLLEVNAQEKIFIEDNLQQFYELGFVIEEFGDKEYKISAVPHILGGNFDCKSFFDDVLSQIGKEIKAKEMLRFDEYLMQRACKSAIKGGNDINENEICSLVDAVLENNTELFCPHGRPIAIKIDKKDIEKWFKRVL